MKCTRCHGLMVRHYIVDLLATENGGLAWRCVSCGDMWDSVILANGRRRLGTASVVVKKVRTSGDLIAA
ncbi:MAG: hypothetical protein CV090_13695 [Nitrospira sp. WS238]|nr:hypothetical protein [Nitrospira sp. WS238]